MLSHYHITKVLSLPVLICGLVGGDVWGRIVAYKTVSSLMSGGLWIFHTASGSTWMYYILLLLGRGSSVLLFISLTVLKPQPRFHIDWRTKHVSDPHVILPWKSEPMHWWGHSMLQTMTLHRDVSQLFHLLITSTLTVCTETRVRGTECNHRGLSDNEYAKLWQR